MGTRLVRATLVIGMIAIAALLTASSAWSQVVTSEIRGTVVDQDGNAIDGVQVIVTDTRTNTSFGTITSSSGRFLVLHLQPGGPYSVAAQSIGYRTAIQQGIAVTLGQATRVNFQLEQTAVEVEALTVSVEGVTGAVFSADHTGQATQISALEIETFPTRSRNLLELTLLSPYVNQFENAPSIAGKANRFNNILIDGAVTNDVFGVGESGIPGGSVNSKPISLEAVEQMQVLVAPFDVRHSNFTGGLINAVTKSGTNEWGFSAFGYHSNESFIGDIGESGFSEFDDTQFGGSFGGPIARDKAFIFAAGEFQITNRPFDGFELGACNDRCMSVGADPAEAAEIANILRDVYGVDPGTPGAVPLKNPRTNIFGRLDFNLGSKNRLVIRDNYIHGSNLLQCSRNSREYCFTSNLGPFITDYNSLVAELFSQLGTNWANELLLNYSRTKEDRDPLSDFAEITVESSGPDYVFGAERFSQANRQLHKVFQLTDNLTMNTGDHRLTFGTSNEFYSFFNLFQESLIGLYVFESADDLRNNTPDSYVKRVTVPGGPTGDVVSEFNAIQLGFYVQDQWTVSDRFTLNFGLRAEIPILPDEPRFNADALEILGINTSEVPSGNVLWQPRLGLNWNSGADLQTQIRGGVGLFGGRSPYVWISNSYGNTGKESNLIFCSGANAPGFDPNSRPTTCVDGTGAGEALVDVWYADPDFKFPLDLKVSGGIDQQLPGGLSATFEVLYTKAIEEVFFEETNLRGIQSNDATQGGRPVYGDPVDFDPVLGRSCGNRGGCFTNTRIDPRFAHAVKLTNRSDSKALLLTFQLRRQFMDWLSFNTSYTYANVDDLQVQASSQATSNIGRNAIDADLNNPDLVPSSYGRPHKVVLAATGSWTFGAGWLLQVTPQYFGQAGLPYSLVTRGDPNGDGYRDPTRSRDNDLIYIPTNSSELVWDGPDDQQEFDALIADNECLQEQRGGIMGRNSCRYDWNDRFNMNITFGIPTGSRGRVELVADVINLFGSEWREGRVDRGIDVLQVRGRDEATGALVYRYTGPSPDSEGRIDPAFSVSPESRTQWQLGLRFRW